MLFHPALQRELKRCHRAVVLLDFRWRIDKQNIFGVIDEQPEPDIILGVGGLSAVRGWRRTNLAIREIHGETIGLAFPTVINTVERGLRTVYGTQQWLCRVLAYGRFDGASLPRCNTGKLEMSGCFVSAPNPLFLVAGNTLTADRPSVWHFEQVNEQARAAVEHGLATIAAIMRAAVVIAAHIAQFRLAAARAETARRNPKTVDLILRAFVIDKVVWTELSNCQESCVADKLAVFARNVHANWKPREIVSGEEALARQVTVGPD